jgi:hypothetical protein
MSAETRVNDAVKTVTGVPSTLDDWGDIEWLGAQLEDQITGSNSPAKIEKVVKLVSKSDFSVGGLSCAMERLRVEAVIGGTENGSSIVELSLILKTRGGDPEDAGTYKEAFFLTDEGGFLSKLTKPGLGNLGSGNCATFCVPQVFYAYSDGVSGQKVLLMEDLSATTVQSGWFFGSGSPLNWGKDLPAVLAEKNYGADVPAPSAEQVAAEAFRQIAVLHGTFWTGGGSEKALAAGAFSPPSRQRKGTIAATIPDWLRGYDWLRGEGRQGWEKAQAFARDSWREVKEGVAEI